MSVFTGSVQTETRRVFCGWGCGGARRGGKQAGERTAQHLHQVAGGIRTVPQFPVAQPVKKHAGKGLGVKGAEEFLKGWLGMHAKLLLDPIQEGAHHVPEISGKKAVQLVPPHRVAGTFE